MQPPRPPQAPNPKRERWTSKRAETKAPPSRSGSPPVIIKCTEWGRRATPTGTNREPKNTDM
jgi:hypothetical protein